MPKFRQFFSPGEKFSWGGESPVTSAFAYTTQAICICKLHYRDNWRVTWRLSCDQGGYLCRNPGESPFTFPFRALGTPAYLRGRSRLGPSPQLGASCTANTIWIPLFRLFTVNSASHCTRQGPLSRSSKGRSRLGPSPQLGASRTQQMHQFRQAVTVLSNSQLEENSF